jgi:hypothetical protein
MLVVLQWHGCHGCHGCATAAKCKLAYKVGVVVFAGQYDCHSRVVLFWLLQVHKRMQSLLHLMEKVVCAPHNNVFGRRHLWYTQKMLAKVFGVVSLTITECMTRGGLPKLRMHTLATELCAWKPWNYANT